MKLFGERSKRQNFWCEKIPRFYWFTFFSALFLGAYGHDLYLLKSIQAYQILIITVTLVAVLANEKYAFFEDMLSTQLRKVLIAATITTLSILWVKALTG